jgi:hypothetical protein
MSPLSTYYSSEVQRWMQQHPGRPITISQIGKLFGNAFRKAASIQTAINGFTKTGVHPINPEIFEDWMFEPAETTNRPFEDHTNIQSEENDDPLPLITNASSEAPPISPPKTPPRPTIFLSKPQETNNELLQIHQAHRTQVQILQISFMQMQHLHALIAQRIL